MNMQALVQYEKGSRKVRLETIPAPDELGPKDILMRVQAVGVCGSDLHIYHGTNGFPVKPRLVLGHEFTGVVVDVGPEVRLFRKGDRIVSETPVYVCDACVYCRSGQFDLCPRRLAFGATADGGMAQYVRTREAICHRVPDGLSPVQAALTEPAAVAYNAVAHHSHIRPGDHVVIIGPGPIGLMCLQVAKLASPGHLAIVGTKRDAQRLALAERFGADEVIVVEEEDAVARTMAVGDGFGADLVVDCVGISATLQSSIEMVRHGGQVTKVGWGPQPVGFSLDPLIQKAARLQGSFSHKYYQWENVLKLMARQALDPLPMTKVYGMDDWERAFDEMHALQHAKSVLLPNGDEGFPIG
ncbi:zinc-binding dehydrogenase [Cohnella cellulosilytica]|uniref:Zinc-binding dehydrogenase n=2 Tax=Cohnella cellulosilytica TaxID=986710 RepID=A0ABW2FJ56_9BACL